MAECGDAGSANIPAAARQRCGKPYVQAYSGGSAGFQSSGAFSAATGKRSRGFCRNSSSLRDLCQAGELGFEPRLTDPESVVLPLHHSPSYVAAETCAKLRSTRHHVAPDRPSAELGAHISNRDAEGSRPKMLGIVS
jgi:hypothetical protein